MSTTDSAPRRAAALGRSLVLGATLLWASTATLARQYFRTTALDSFTVVEMRLLIATSVLLAYLAIARRASLRIERRDVPYMLTLGLFGVATVQGSYYFTISKLGVGLAILLQYLAPTLIVGFDLVRGRWVGWSMLIAVLLALAGTALLVGGVNATALAAKPLYWVVGFFSAFAFAFYVVYSKRGLERYAPETVLLYTFATAGIFWAFKTPPWRIVAAHYDASIWALFGILGLFSTLVPFALFYSGLRRLPAAEASVIATAEPLAAIVFAAIFLHERLGPMQLFGAALVLGAALLASKDRPEAPAAAVERG